LKEIKTASNIKNKSVGKSVANALRKIQHELNQIKKLDPNGLVIFSGEYNIKEIDSTKSTQEESYV